MSRYGLLLAALSAMLLLVPPLAELEEGFLFTAGVFSMVLLACAVAIGDWRSARRISLALAIGAIAGDALVRFFPYAPLVLVVRGVTAGFVGFVTGAILLRVVREEQVSDDTILGGICVYLLLGLFFESVFEIVEFALPGSFRSGAAALGELAESQGDVGRYPALVYYSFVTLTTLGYGDITPIGALPRALSTVEAVIGQLYLAILVAALVSMRLAERPTRTGGDMP
jgi:hypothetical protein